MRIAVTNNYSLKLGHSALKCLHLIICFPADASKKSDSNPLTEILKCPTKVVLLRVRCRWKTCWPTWVLCVTLSSSIPACFHPTDTMTVKTESNSFANDTFG